MTLLHHMYPSSTAVLSHPPPDKAFYSIAPSSLAKSARVRASGLCRKPPKRTAEFLDTEAGEVIDNSHTPKKHSPPPFCPHLTPPSSQSPKSTISDASSPLCPPITQPTLANTTQHHNTIKSLSDLNKKNKISGSSIVKTTTQRYTQTSATTVRRSSCAGTEPGSSISTATTPKPIQFINNVAPAAPRPKPPAMGTYVQTQSAIQQKARKQSREEGKVKRASNCFIKYRTHIHPLIVAWYGNQNNKVVSQLAGQLWRNESESVKNFYRQQANEEKLRHESLYPTYKYSPARSGQSKRRSGTGVEAHTKDQVDTSSRAPSPSVEVRKMDGSEPEGSQRAMKSESRLAKPAQKKRFVVTETALLDFSGDSKLTSTQKHKHRSGGRSPSASSPVSGSTSKKYGTAGQDSFPKDCAMIHSMDHPGAFAFAVQGSSPTTPSPSAGDLVPVHSQQDHAPSTLMSILNTLSPFASSGLQDPSAASIVPDHLLESSAMLAPQIWTHAAGHFDISSTSVTALSAIPIISDVATMSLTSSLRQTMSTAMDFIVPARRRSSIDMTYMELDPPMQDHTATLAMHPSPTLHLQHNQDTSPPLPALQQLLYQQQGQPTPFQVPESCASDFNQGFPWHLGIITTPGAAVDVVFDATNPYYSPETMPAEYGSSLLTAANVLSVSPQPLTPGSNPMLSSAAVAYHYGWTDKNPTDLLPRAAKEAGGFQLPLPSTSSGVLSAQTELSVQYALGVYESGNEVGYTDLGAADVMAAAWTSTGEDYPSGNRFSMDTATSFGMQQQQAPRRLFMEGGAHDYSDEELSISIEYYERVLEMQKTRLAQQRQMKQQQQQ